MKKQIFLAPVALSLQLEFRLFSAGSIVKMNNINGVNIVVSSETPNVFGIAQSAYSFYFVSAVRG